MAFCLNINKGIYMAILRSIVPKIHQKLYSKNKFLEVNGENALDDFTKRLMQNKVDQWGYKKKIVKKNYTNKGLINVFKNNKPENDSIKDSSISEIDLLLQEAIDFGDNVTLLDLTRQCVKYDKCPSLPILLHALSVCSQNGNKDTIMDVVQLCEKLKPDFLQENSNFEHYLAEAIWNKGNIVKSLEIFAKIYKENMYLRRNIRIILKNLIEDALHNKSEAILSNMIHFCEHLAEDYNDYYPLGCVWQICFLSNWFADQQTSLELLQKYKGLYKAIVYRIPYVVKISLLNHQTEPVYRLTEILLKYNMKNELPDVILALIDYFIKSRDMRRCNELVKWTVKNNIEVPKVLLNGKLLKMFINELSTLSDVNDGAHKYPITKYKF